MADFRVLITYIPEDDEDFEIDLCQQINALIGQPVPENAGVVGQIITDIDKIYFSPYSNGLIILANTKEAV
jgi:hypothetical protein